MKLLRELFRGQQLWVDSDGDGIVDDVRLRIVVSRSLKGRRVWAEIGHLCARLAFKTVALGGPLVCFSDRAANGPRLVLRLSRRRGRSRGPGANGELVLSREFPAVLVAESECPQQLATFLRLLSMDHAGLAWDIPAEWGQVRWSADGTVRARFLDPSGRLVDEKRYPAPPVHFFARRITNDAERSSLPLDPLNLSGDSGCYETPADRPRSRRLNLALHLFGQELCARVGMALCDAVTQLVLEATELDLPFIGVEREDRHRNLIEIGEDSTCGVPLVRVHDHDPRRLVLRGRAAGLAELLRRWLPWVVREPGPGAEPIEGIRRRIRTVRDLLTGRGEAGSWAAFLAARATASVPGKRVDELCPPRPLPNLTRGMEKRVRSACLALGLDVPKRSKRLQPVRRRSRWQPEQNRALALIRNLAPGEGDVVGTVLVSKPARIRRELEERLEEETAARGYRPRFRVFNAYKPGLCWLLEEILPSLEGTSPSCSRVEIRFRDFTGPTGTLEAPSRWLQEIYPGPDLLARSLALGLDRIALVMEPGQREVYRVRAWDDDGRLILDRGFSPRWRQLAYGAGSRSGSPRWVHPVSGWIQLERDGEILLDETFSTDRERFWIRFTNHWLPELQGVMEQRLQREGVRPAAAFWEALRVEVTLDETDEPLGLDQERVSPMEALHEDIYFVLLDFYRDFADRWALSDSVRLGQVIPVVRWSTGGNKPQARLHAVPMEWPLSADPVQACFKEVTVRSVRLHGRHWAVELEPKAVSGRPAPAPRLTAYLKILRAWGHRVEPAAESGRFLVWVKAPAGNRSLLSEWRAEGSGSEKAVDIEFKKPPPMDRILSAEEVTWWVRRLGRHPRLRSWQAGVSSRGRPVWALEGTGEDPGKRWSLARRRLLKPTLLFNARHHANEVSSTEAALRTAWLAATNETWRARLKDINLTWIPMENVDGVAVFERLHPTAPGHMLHAARYNAFGAEFYPDYFRCKPRFVDADAKRRVWRRWLPQLILDGHGVPSHEWTQPFSGYLPGIFEEHWIPRAFLYVYIPFLNSETDPRRARAEEMAIAISRQVAGDPDLVACNRAIRDRYRRYATGWEPQRFPPAGRGPLLVLPPVERVASLTYAVQCPEVTLLEVVSEVVDETARGEWLERCVRGHIRVLEGMIKTLRTHPIQAIVTATGAEFGVRLAWQTGLEPTGRRKGGQR